MADLFGALSSCKDRFYSFVSEKWRQFCDWAELNVKKYRFKKWFRRKKAWLREKLNTYGRAYFRFVCFEFAPYIAAFGLMINFPLSVLLGWSLTVETVVSWGLVFYFVDEELTSIANELKPYIRISAKVDS